MNQSQTEPAQPAQPPAESQPAPPKKGGCLGCFIKGTIVGVLLLIILIGGAAIIIGNQLDELARKAIEMGGKHSLGVETKVEKVDIGLFAGTFDIDNIDIANVPGFQDPRFMLLQRGEIAITLESLQEQTVELPYLRLDGIDVYVERKDGTANYDVLMEYVNQRRSEPQETPTDPATDKGFVVRELVIDNVTVHVKTDLLGGTSDDIALPTIRMTDVGQDTDYGAQVAEITDIIVRAILATLVKKGVGILPAQLLGDMEGQLEKLGPLGDLGIETLGEATGMAEDIVGAASGIAGSLTDPDKTADEKVQDVTDTVRGTAEQAGERAGSILEGIGGALGGKKEDEQAE